LIHDNYTDHRKWSNNSDDVAETPYLKEKVGSDLSSEDTKVNNELTIADTDEKCTEKMTNNLPSQFIRADRLDLLIIKELLKEPEIQTLEISLKLGISLSMAHKKRRLIESQLLQKRYSLVLEKLGFDFRFADVFADILHEEKIEDIVRNLLESSHSKNILKIIKIKKPQTGICINSLYQDSEELFFLMDKLKSFPFVSNVFFSEQVLCLGDYTANRILKIIDTVSKNKK